MLATTPATTHNARATTMHTTPATPATLPACKATLRATLATATANYLASGGRVVRLAPGAAYGAALPWRVWVAPGSIGHRKGTAGAAGAWR